MSWRKMGRVFNASGQADWMRAHAAVPFAWHRGGNSFDVFFSSRDAEQRSYTGRLVMELGESARVLDLDTTPTLAPGELGCFDDSGAMLSWIAQVGEERYYYYIGWNRGVTVPFRNALGQAARAIGTLA